MAAWLIVWEISDLAPIKWVYDTSCYFGGKVAGIEPHPENRLRMMAMVRFEDREKARVFSQHARPRGQEPIKEE